MAVRGRMEKPKKGLDEADWRLDGGKVAFGWR